MSPNKSKQQSTNPQQQGENGEEEEEEEEIDIENLETEIEQMAQKIQLLRSNTPHQLKTAFTSLLAAKRPVFCHSVSGSTRHPGPNLDVGIQVESDATVEDQVAIEKEVSLKRKISSNISSMSALLERMNKCFSKLDTFYCLDDIIPPAFKKKRTF